MSPHVNFNLDELSSLRFQDLCNALLLKYFSQLIDSIVRPGRDGQLDGRLEMLPINYSDLLNKPFGYKTADGKDILYVFQCKHTQIGDETLRQKSVLKALKKEIAEWEKKEKRPTHYFLLTNVNLKASQVVEICSLGRAFFGFFDIWHEPKISGYISGDISLQKAFFPNRISNIDFKSLEQAMVLAKNLDEDHKNRATSDGKKKLESNENDIRESIQSLAEYEIRFQKANESLSLALKASGEHLEVPKEWESCSYTAKDCGILVLSDNEEGLQWLSNVIALNEAKVTSWQRRLGEEVTQGDIAITLKCNPDLKIQLTTNLDAIFTITSFNNHAYEETDRYLRELESKILNDIKNSRIQDVQDGLRQMYRIRQLYSLAKAGYSTAFYPNVRVFAGKPIMGWDFNNLWENIFQNIYDIAFSDKIPETLRDLLLSIPFVLCGEVIRKNQNKESFRIELATLKIPLSMIAKSSDQVLVGLFIDKLEDLAQEIADIDIRIRSVSQAEWALSIISEFAKYIANLGWLALSKRILGLPFDQLLKILTISTSLGFNGVRNEMPYVKDTSAKQRNLQKAIAMIKDEYIFAWATFEWSQQRANGFNDSAFTIKLLKKLKMRDIVSFYNSNKFDRDGWIGEWFIPIGKRVSWSWNLDHDIKEALQLSILVLPINTDSFKELVELADRKWSSKFLNETRELFNQLKSKGVEIDFQKCMSVLETAISLQESHLKALIANQPLSELILREIQQEFQEEMLEKSNEAILYSIENISSGVNLEPSHTVGPYFLDDKNYFIDQVGSIYYMSKDIGNNCATILNSQREQLLIECAKKSATFSEYDPCQLEEVLEKICRLSQEDWLLVVSPSILPQIIDSKLFLTKNGEDFRRSYGKIGVLSVLTSVALKHDEILMMPKLGFTWYADKKIDNLDIKLIDENSKLAGQIIQANPGIELGGKVLVDGRENGIMISQAGILCKYFKEHSATSI